MSGYRRFGSRLQGHPTPVLPWVDVATGSLGQGLPDGVGVALAGKYLDRLPFRVWVLCGDSELAEGSIWEALDKAGHYGLSNLIAIVDVNRLGQRGPTELGWDLEAYARRAEAFGAHAVHGRRTRSHRRSMRRCRPRRGRGGRPTDCDSRPHHQGPGVLRGRGPRGLAREAVPRGTWPTRAIAELGGESNLLVRGPLPEYENPNDAGSAPEASPAISRADAYSREVTRSPPAEAYGDARDRSRRPRPSRRRPRRRGQQLHLRRRSSPRPIRAATSRCSSPSNRWWHRRSA